MSIPTAEHHDTCLSHRSPQFESPAFQAPPPPLEIDYGFSAQEEEQPQNITVERCRAEELSQGEALWMLLVLGIGCVVHMPGSITWLGHKGLYRLIPEFGILEAVVLLVLILKGVFHHHQPLRRSIRASLALRSALGEGESWWLVSTPLSTAPITPATFTSALADQEMHLAPLALSPNDALDRLDPFLTSLATFSVSRLLSTTVTTLAIAKAATVTGSLRTTVLACSYYASFLLIDSLAWACLSPGPPPSAGERKHEAHAIARLMAALDPFRGDVAAKTGRQPQQLTHQAYDDYIAAQGTLLSIAGWPASSSSSSSSTKKWDRWARLALAGAVWLAYALAGLVVAISTFWPVSVPLFLVFEFSHVRRGKWVFEYLNSVIWAFWAAVAAAVFFLSTFAVAKLRRKGFREVVGEVHQKYVPPSWAGLNFLVGGYGVLKVTLIVRMYFHEYTGVGTRMPNWASWLG